jgi:hypothetical protein
MIALAVIEFMNNHPSGGVIVFLGVVTYLFLTAYIPYETLKALTDGQDPSNRFSIEITPPTTANSAYTGLTWGFVWRLAVVSALLAVPFQLTNYSPDELEGFLVSLMLLLVSCLGASWWLVFKPLGKYRLRTMTIDPKERDAS